jgi:predicted PurR-regulated permease PerM
MNISLTPETEHLLQMFIILSSVLLIPVVVGLIVIAFKFAFLLHSASEFLAFASNELTPVIQDLRSIADRLENISQKASSGVEDLGNTLTQAGPLLKGGMAKATSGLSSLLAGIGRSFLRSS